MKNIFILLICISPCFVLSQQKAVTELGEEVVLYEDGTWAYLSPDVKKDVEIPINPTPFEKMSTSSFLLKSNSINAGFWLNPKKWSFKKAIDNPDAEYELQLKDGDLYGMVISEAVEIPITTLKNIALENGRAVAPDLKIIKEEFRHVNGLKVLLLQMHGTMQGIKIAYNGYYFSNASGTLQFITYTSQNLMKEYMNESEELLNGLVEIE